MRTTVTLPEPLHRNLRRLAAERGVSMADVIREAVEDMLASKRVKPRSLGIGASGYTDTSVRMANERPEPR